MASIPGGARWCRVEVEQRDTLLLAGCVGGKSTERDERLRRKNPAPWKGFERGRKTRLER
jgi:hypothetical protein